MGISINQAIVVRIIDFNNCKNETKNDNAHSMITSYNEYMRKIIHLDLDAFFCAVEEKHRPELRGKKFAVGGSPSQRGVVSSCSYAARADGVHSAMPVQRALQICPELQVVHGNHSLYRRYSHHVMAVLREFTQRIEQISIDEAFLDVSDHQGNVRELASMIQHRVNTEVHLPCSVGVASNKLVAKIANGYGKSKFRGNGFPNALTVIAPGFEREFLNPLPVDDLWGVGPKTAERLEKIGIHTIGDCAAANEKTMFDIFGQNGLDLIRHAQGIDDREVETGYAQAKSISQEHTFARDVGDETILRDRIRVIAYQVVRHMNDDRLRASIVKIKIRWGDFTTFTRQKTCALTDDLQVIEKLALQLFEQAWIRGKEVRLIGMGVSGLAPRAQQMNLWDKEVQRNQKLFDTVSIVSERFGSHVLVLGSEFTEEHDSQKKKMKGQA